MIPPGCDAEFAAGMEHVLETYAKPPDPARALARRVEFCHTPKHGSWLNVAESELSCMTRQCLANRRIGDIRTLRRSSRRGRTM